MKLIKDLGTFYPTNKSKSKKRYGLYECPSCKDEFKTQTANVKRGGVKMCRSCATKLIGKKNIKHGCSLTGDRNRLYTIWQLMKQRCQNENSKGHKHYGGRGISVCQKWSSSFLNFKEWAELNGYSKELSIDRINNDGNYEPNNCRWTNDNVQARNTRLLRSDNKSGYRNVNKTRSGKWSARIGINGESIHVKTCNTAIEAAKAYDKYVLDNNLEHTRNFA